MQLELNAHAALIYRGLAEIIKFGVKMEGKSETFSGMTGFVNLVLTGKDSLSRNHDLGIQIGQGITPKDSFKNKKTITEGVKTSISLQKLSRLHQVEMPICDAMYKNFHGELYPKKTLIQLFEREIPGSET